MLSSAALALLHSEQVINISGEESRKFARLVLAFYSINEQTINS